MIKRFIIAIVLLVVVCGGIVGFNLFRDNAIQQFFANMPVQSMTVSTITVEPRKWTPGIEAIGTVGAARGVDLTVETTGIVKEINFEANQRVEANGTLVVLDNAVQQADLEAAKTQAALDRQSFQRADELRKRGVGSDVTLDAARAAASNSESQVAKLQAVLDQKLLKAPFAGTAGIPRVEVGQFVQPGTTVVTLQDLETMRVDFSVPEQQLEKLKMGQAVKLGITAADLPFKGEITGIEPKVDPVSRLVSVRASIDNPEGRLSPGQFIQVRVLLPEEDNVIAIPQTSLVSSLYGDFVYVIRPADEVKKAEESPAEDAAAAKEQADAAKPAAEEAKPTDANAEEKLAVAQVFVKIGRRLDGVVEITDGVSANDRVVTAGQNRLSNGTPVTIDNTIDPTKTAQPEAPAQ